MCVCVGVCVCVWCRTTIKRALHYDPQTTKPHHPKLCGHLAQEPKIPRTVFLQLGGSGINPRLRSRLHGSVRHSSDVPPVWGSYTGAAGSG